MPHTTFSRPLLRAVTLSLLLALREKGRRICCEFSAVVSSKPWVCVFQRRGGRQEWARQETDPFSVHPLGVGLMRG